MAERKESIQIWPIGSGKGGVGKTLLTANLGILLSQMNKKVVILDTDLGASNLHTAIGMPYVHRGLNDLLTGAARELSDIALETPVPGLRLIGGSRQLPAYPDYAKELTRKLLNGIPSLEADILLIDLAGGIASTILDLFLLSDHGVVVITNDPASIQNTYQFLKMAVYRKILRAFPNNPLIAYMVHSATNPTNQNRITSIPMLLEKISLVDHHYTDVIRKILKPFSPRMIVNMTHEWNDRRAADVVGSVCRKFVGINPELAGIMEYDQGIKKSTHQLRPFCLDNENQKATEQLSLIAGELIEAGPRKAWDPVKIVVKTAPAEPPPEEKQEVWLMDNIQYNDRPLYVLTEKLSGDGSIQTSVYSHGRILFSRKLDYSELLNGKTEESVLQELVRKQHLTALKGIQKGRLPIESIDR